MNQTDDSKNQHSQPSLESLLKSHRQSGRWRRWLGLIVILLAVVLAIMYWDYQKSIETSTPKYTTAKIERGNLIVTVTATGNLEPTNQVNVGSELSGTIEKVFVDDDDRVTKGQVLAQLDTAKFDDAVASSKAALMVAQAKLQQTKATELEAQAKLDRYQDVARRSGNKVPSLTEMDAAKADMARASADVASAEAAIAEAKAALRTNETNLSKAYIRSPIDGVVLERAIDPGQAVAASLQAVTLFILAEDLSKMELKVEVDEADVGQVRAGQKASFTVDAWPGRQFEATITRVGFNATNDAGVISYPAVLQVDNSDLSLRPGMTGTAQITTLEHHNVLLIPNAALRFTPVESTASVQSRRSILSSLIPRPPRSRTKSQEPTLTANGDHQIWLLKNNQAVPVAIKTGASNGRYTEVLSGDIKTGAQVITEAVETQ